MNMDQAAVWLSGSILAMLGFVVIVIGVLIINNLFYKYWKPVQWVKYDYRPVYYDPKTGEQFLSPEDPPLGEEVKGPHVKSN